QDFQCVVRSSTPWIVQSRYRCGIQLLKPVERSGLHVGYNFGDRRELNRLPRRPSNKQFQQVVRCQALASLDLGDNLVTTALNAEIIRVTAAKQRGQIPPNLLEVDTHRCNLVAIEFNLRLGQIIFQIAVGKNKLTALHRSFYKLLRKLVNLSWFGGG